MTSIYSRMSSAVVAPVEYDVAVTLEEFIAARDSCPVLTVTDQGYRIGDGVRIVCESPAIDPRTVIHARVAYVLRGAFFHVAPGCAVLSIANVVEVPRG